MNTYNDTSNCQNPIIYWSNSRFHHRTARCEGSSDIPAYRQAGVIGHNYDLIYHIKASKIITPPRPTTATMVSINDQDFRVSLTLTLKYSLKSQNPASLK